VVDAATFLNDQPWAKPVETETSNFGVNFQYELSPEWKATLSANQHRFKRDDYTAFPYGCSSESLWPGYCANGDYDVYDYRSLGEEKKPLSARAQLQGKFATGGIRHELTAGLSFFSNKERWGDYVYDLAGVSNIFHPVAVPMTTGVVGEVSERRTNHERSAYVHDIMGLTNELALHAGVRYASLRRNEAGVAPVRENFWLPNVSLVYSPSAKLSYYANYAQGLQYGSVAPIGTTNDAHALAPGKSKQVEVGAKAEINGVSLSSALYQIDQGLEFTDPASNTFVRSGQERHRGLEFSAQGKVTRELLLGASLAAIHTEQEGSGLADFDGKRVTNVPGLKLTANWQFSGKKAFDLQNKVMVPSYHVVNLGGSYATRVSGSTVILRAQVKNAFDKFYWRDVTPELGGYLFPGSPRSFQLSAHVDF
jgi:iron complex outermembrane receptor protein